MIGFDDIEYASLTDVGVRRSHNQDSFAALPANDPEQWRNRGHVFLVADGMGGHAVGELASKLAADSIPHIYTKHSQEGAAAAIRRAFVEANLCIHNRGQQNREFAGMGTTGTALFLRPEGAWVGHVGDSRCYRVRNGKIEQLSFDHSYQWEMARRQNKQPEELKGIQSNIIIRSLGPEPFVQVDIEGPHPVEPGDLYLLCSDGLSGPVTDREIGAVVSALPPDEACRFLIHLANLQGGPDNITLVVVRIRKPGEGQDQGAAARTNEHAARTSSELAALMVRFWPLELLTLGILLAVIAIYLTAYTITGGVPAFVLAAIALMGGLGGLILQSVREHTNAPAAGEEPRPLKTYRESDCTIDPTVLERLRIAEATLQERIRERDWQVDWDGFRYHFDLGKKHEQNGDLAASFREHSRAILFMMEAISRQRNKEEAFKPLWDQAPV